MAELTLRPRGARGRPGARGADLRWVLVVGGAAALVIGYVLTVSVQAACAVTLVLTVLALYRHNRTWGIAGLFALWFLAPLLRRLFGLMTGYIDQDPLSVAPFVATMAMVGLELLRLRLPDRVRKILLVAAAGMALGLPIGILHGPSSAIYAFIAYVAGRLGRGAGLHGAGVGRAQRAAQASCSSASRRSPPTPSTSARCTCPTGTGPGCRRRSSRASATRSRGRSGPSAR